MAHRCSDTQPFYWCTQPSCGLGGACSRGLHVLFSVNGKTQNPNPGFLLSLSASAGSLLLLIQALPPHTFKCFYFMWLGVMGLTCFSCQAKSAK